MASRKIVCVQLKNFVVSDVIFDKPKPETGKKDISIKYKYADGNVGPLRIQLPKARTSFGISAFENEKPLNQPTLTSKDSLSVNIEDAPYFIEKMEAFDKAALDIGFEYSGELLELHEDDDAMKMRLVKQNFTPSVKYSKDKVTKKRSDLYPPSFKANIFKDKVTGVYTHKFYTNKDSVESVPTVVSYENAPTFIPRNSEIKQIVKCSGVWCKSKKFGLSWIPEQIQVYKNNARLTEFAFEKDSDSEEEEDEEENDEEDDATSPEEYGSDVEELVEELKEVVIEEPKKKTTRRKKNVE